MCRALTVLCALLAHGCEASIEGGPRQGANDGGTSDAFTASTTPDAAQCANGRVVYLNFEGVTLTDAAASDATQNRASWITGQTQGTATPFLQGVGNRAQVIADITTGVTNALAQFPVTVVTQRPATGPYVMIVYGGTAAAVGSAYGFAVNELDCDDSEKSDVAWISNNYTTTLRHVNTTIGAIGFGLGLTATTDVNDCMCGWANGCDQDQTQLCKLTPNIARDQAASQRCGNLATQNEVATFKTAFCQ
ncbi:MAG TPA: hypothetical protein VK427_13420 [Kofleriaceae bacterium]|nr:hypothetical protein [Kofleriaceae bacterium]